MTDARVDRLFQMYREKHSGSFSSMIEDHEYWDMFYEWRRVENPAYVRAFDAWEKKTFGEPFEPPPGYVRPDQRYWQQVAKRNEEAA